MTDESSATPTSADRKRQRDEAICAYYLEGHKLVECASKFQLGRQRVLQILKTAGVWKPYVKTNRTQFLGVSVKEETKSALAVKAEENGISVSRYASDVLDEAVRDEVVRDEAVRDEAVRDEAVRDEAAVKP